MSKLDELIKKYCPNGVPYLCLGEVGQVKMCKRILKSQTNDTNGVPFYKIGTFGKEAQSYISEELYNDYRNRFSYPKKGEILISAAGTIGRTVIYDGQPAYYQDSNIVWLSHDESLVLNTYLNYCYETKPWNISSGGTISRLYNNDLLNTKIPVPPLPVQEEIVRILDSFTSLTAELQDKLTMELQTRKKQYEYYKNMILALENEHPVPLKSICNNIYSGKNKKRRDNGIFPVYGSTGIISRTDCAIYHKKQILIARVGANAGYVHIADGDYDVSDNTLIVDVNNDVSLKYIYYQLSSMNLHKYAKGGGQPLVTASQMKEIMLPLPSKNKQQKIVDILDRFDTLCNDITTGIPAEIAARQKQYEYYRDKLLTFKELS